MASGFYCRWSPIRFSVWLIFNMILQLWADMKYHVPTGFGFSPKARGFYPFGDATDLVRGRRW